MFKRDKQDTPKAGLPAMLVATVDTLPGRTYEALGTVVTMETTVFGKAPFAEAQAALVEQARALGADAILGASFTVSNSPNKAFMVIASGTAVRFTA